MAQNWAEYGSKMADLGHFALFSQDLLCHTILANQKKMDLLFFILYHIFYKKPIKRPMTTDDHRALFIFPHQNNHEANSEGCERRKLV